MVRWYVLVPLLVACGSSQAAVASQAADPSNGAESTGDGATDGATPESSESEESAVRSCAPTEGVCRPNAERFVLMYDGENHALEPHPDNTTVYAQSSQHLVVCVCNGDYRDTYNITTRLLDEGDMTRGEPQAIAMSTSDVLREVMGNGDDPRYESAGTRCAAEVSRVTVSIESERLALLDALRDALRRRVRRSERAALSRRLRALNMPSSDRAVLPCHLGRGPVGDAGTRAPVPDGVVRRCSFEATVNLQLPSWLWVLDGRVIFLHPEYDETRQGCGFLNSRAGVSVAGPADAGRRRRDEIEEYFARGRLARLIDGRDAECESSSSDGGLDAGTADGGGCPPPAPVAIQREMAHLVRAIVQTRRLLDFGQELLDDLHPPRARVNLGQFSGGSRVQIRVNRVRTGISYSDGKIGRTAEASAHIYNVAVHGTTWLRIEPGLAFSPLRQPRYSVGQDGFGESVIRLDTPNYQVAFPAIFASFHYCGVDTQLAPWEQRCPDSTMQWVNLFVPAPTIGVTISQDGTPDLFLGGLWNLLPGLGIAVGAHIGIEVPQLRPEFRVGDPVGTSGIESFTTTGTEATWFVSVTVTEEVLARLSASSAPVTTAQ